MPDLVAAAAALKRMAAALGVAELKRDYTDVRAGYRQAIYLAVLRYLVQDQARSTAFKSEAGQAVLEAFPETFTAAYRAAGGGVPEPADDAWLTAKINAEVAHVAELFVGLRDLRREKLPPGQLVAEANARADGYARTLDGVFDQAMLRGSKNRMLTLDGDDGHENCSTCRRLKGERHSAGWWLRHDLVPTRGNPRYECGVWECRHFLRDDNGVRWSYVG